MSTSSEIEIGDEVDVIMLSSPDFTGFVRRVAAATGDCWIIEEENETVHAIQTFEQIIRRPGRAK